MGMLREKVPGANQKGRGGVGSRDDEIGERVGVLVEKGWRGKSGQCRAVEEEEESGVAETGRRGDGETGRGGMPQCVGDGRAEMGFEVSTEH
jgi:hypothetical protein